MGVGVSMGVTFTENLSCNQDQDTETLAQVSRGSYGQDPSSGSSSVGGAVFAFGLSLHCPNR